MQYSDMNIFQFHEKFRHTHTHLWAHSVSQHTAAQVELWHWPIYKTSLQLQLNYSWQDGAVKHISLSEA